MYQSYSWKGSCRSSSPTLLPRQGELLQVTLGFGMFRWVWNVSRGGDSMTDCYSALHPQCKEFLHYIGMKLLVNLWQ